MLGVLRNRRAIFIYNSTYFAAWITGWRLFWAGVLLLLIYKLTTHNSLLGIWKDSKSLWELIVFGVLGVMPSQLFYFLGINYSNAATATVLQFTSPIFIMIYLAYVKHHVYLMDVISIVGVLFGTFMLVTGGHIGQLNVSVLGLICGIFGGLACAIYTILPGHLLHFYRPELLCGWAMIIGSLPLLLGLSTVKQPHFDWPLLIEFVAIVTIGTIVAYGLYLSSLQYLNPMTAGVLSATEPLTTTLFTVLVLGTRFTPGEMLGGSIIILTVILAIIVSGKHKSKN